MNIYTYHADTATLARLVGRVAAHPTTGHPVLVADVEGHYVFVDLRTGQSERMDPVTAVAHGPTWTWYPNAVVVLDGLPAEDAE